MPSNKRLLLPLLFVNILLLCTVPGHLKTTGLTSDNSPFHNQPAKPVADVFGQVAIGSIFSGHCSAVLLCRKGRISF